MPINRENKSNLEAVSKLYGLLENKSFRIPQNHIETIVADFKVEIGYERNTDQLLAFT